MKVRCNYCKNTVDLSFSGALVWHTLKGDETEGIEMKTEIKELCPRSRTNDYERLILQILTRPDRKSWLQRLLEKEYLSQSWYAKPSESPKDDKK